MLISYMTLRDSEAAMTLYGKALGATTTMVMHGPDESIMYAEIAVGGSTFMLSGEWPRHNSPIAVQGV